MKCIQEDIKTVRSKLEKAKIEYEKKRREINEEYRSLKEQEEIVMKRVYGKIRCRNCGEFGNPSSFETEVHYMSGEFGGEYSCKNANNE